MIRFEVKPHDDGDTLGCTFVLTDVFDELGKAARDSAGWHVCLERLAARCAGSEPPSEPSPRWQVVHRAYVERLGPGASVIGPPG